MVILLDAPAELIQRRKQEVPFEETARQVQAYRRVIGGLTIGQTIDAPGRARKLPPTCNGLSWTAWPAHHASISIGRCVVTTLSNAAATPTPALTWTHLVPIERPI